MHLRNIVFLKNNLNSQSIEISGCEFVDFYNGVLLKKSRNLLLLKHDLLETRYDEKTKFEYLLTSDVEKLRFSEIYESGEFSFTDFDVGKKISNLNEKEIAELLFLSHMWKPINNPWINELKNEFIYLSHDDGYYTKLFYKNFDIVESLIEYLVNTKLSESSIKLTKIQMNRLIQLLLTNDNVGLLMDFSESNFKNELPIYFIIKTIPFDDLYNQLNEYKVTSKKTSLI